AAPPNGCSPSRTRAWTPWRWSRRSSCAPASATRPQAMRADLLIIVGAFIVASALAGALGAVNLGTALAFGQIGLAAMTVYVLVRREPDTRPREVNICRHRAGRRRSRTSDPPPFTLTATARST